MHIGVISDTHGLLRPEALDHLAGVAHILHAGDVGDPKILETLRAIAPVTAVRGNVDHGPWAKALPIEEQIELGGHTFYMVHRPEDLAIDPEAAGVGVVIFGHTHLPRIDRRGPVLFLNPGSAGPRRFDKPVTLALLTVEREVEVELVHLLPR